MSQKTLFDADIVAESCSWCMKPLDKCQCHGLGWCEGCGKPGGFCRCCVECDAVGHFECDESGVAVCPQCKAEVKAE